MLKEMRCKLKWALIKQKKTKHTFTRNVSMYLTINKCYPEKCSIVFTLILKIILSVEKAQLKLTKHLNY